MVYESKCTHMNTTEIAEGVRMCENPTCRRLILTNYSLGKSIPMTVEWWG